MSPKIKKSDSNKRLLVGALIGLAAIFGFMFDIAQEFEPPINYILYGILFIIGIMVFFEFINE